MQHEIHITFITKTQTCILHVNILFSFITDGSGTEFNPSKTVQALHKEKFGGPSLIYGKHKNCKTNLSSKQTWLFVFSFIHTPAFESVSMPFCRVGLFLKHWCNFWLNAYLILPMSSNQTTITSALSTASPLP